MLLKHLMWMRLSVNRLLIWLPFTLQDLEVLTPESSEISGVGLYQLGQLAYVINEWHRVNMNE